MNHRMPPLHVGHGTTIGALTVFPVWVEAPVVHGLEWCSAALEVGESAGQPVVGEIVALNRSHRPLVVLEGDIVVGGWQDRMICASRVMAPGESRVLGARCVEHGRWSGQRKHRAGGRRAPPAVCSRNRSPQGTEGDRQQRVWAGVGRYETAFGHSPTAALTDHLDRTVADARRFPRPLEGQQGVIFGIGGQVLGIELFGSPRGLVQRWTGVLEAVLLDAALVPRRATLAGAARSFARSIDQMRADDEADAGLARRVALTWGSLYGCAMSLGESGRLVQLTILDESHPALTVAA